jgi:hypothetical protein
VAGFAPVQWFRLLVVFTADPTKHTIHTNRQRVRSKLILKQHAAKNVFLRVGFAISFRNGTISLLYQILA